MARLKVDNDSIRVLSAFSVSEQLEQIAMRGARYCLPGWFTETTQKNGRVKVDYLGRGVAQSKAREFLDGARSPSDVCGRVISLLVLAHYADEHAVARSSRSFYTLRAPGANSYLYGKDCHSGVPWAPTAQRTLEQLAESRLPEALTAAVRQAREDTDGDHREADASAGPPAGRDNELVDEHAEDDTAPSSAAAQKAA